jgi:hypothetical protein
MGKDSIENFIELWFLEVNYFITRVNRASNIGESTYGKEYYLDLEKWVLMI